MNSEVYNNLSSAMDNCPDERRRFLSCVSVSDESDPNNNYAHLNLGADGRCSFLDNDSLCHIIRQYGQDYLPDTCAFYPRVISEIDQITEISVTTSCPEMVRLLITDTDQMELQALDVSQLPRTTLVPISRQLDSTTSQHYKAKFQEISVGFCSTLFLILCYPF